MKKLTKFLFAISLVTPLLFACSKGNEPIQGNLLEDHSIELQPGAEKAITLTSGVSTETLQWESSDKYIAEVKSNTVKGVSEGRAVIKVTDASTNMFDICKVVVKYSSIAPETTLDIPTIAHRGYHQTAIENTRDAFVEAGRRNFYGIETDIHLTKDGQWICNHDDTIKGMDKPIAQYTYDEIRKVDLSKGEGSIVRVCKFEEYVEVCNIYNKHPIIEFKINPSKQKLEEVFTILNKYDVTNKVIFISTMREVLNSVDKIKQERSYEYDIQLLVNGGSWDDVPSTINVSCEKAMITESMIEYCKAKGQYVAGWTVDNKTTADSLIQMGVKYITTNTFECADKHLDKTLFD